MHLSTREWLVTATVAAFCIFLALLSYSGLARPPEPGAVRASTAGLLLQWTAVCAAAFSAILAGVYYRLHRYPPLLVLTLALAGAALTEAVLALCSGRIIDAGDFTPELLPMIRGLCRLSGAVLVLIAVCALLGRPRHRGTRNTCWAPVIGSTLGVTLYGIIQFSSLTAAGRGATPPFDPAHLLALIPYGLCAVLYCRSGSGRRSTIVATLALSAIPHTVSILWLALAANRPSDPELHLAHGLTATGYVIPAFGLLIAFIQQHARDARFRELHRVQTVYVDLVRHVSAMTWGSQPLDKTLKHCVDLICRSIDWPIGLITVLNTPNGPFSASIRHLADERHLDTFRQMRLHYGTNLVDRVCRASRIVWVGDLSCGNDAAGPTHTPVRSAFGFPIIANGKIVAVAEFFHIQPMPRIPALLRVMEDLGVQLGRVIEHLAAAEALRASEERFELAVRGSADGIWDWQLASDEVYYSPRFKELLGYQNHEFGDRLSDWRDLLHPEDQERVMNAVRAHIHEHQPYDVEYRLRTRLGIYRWFQARGQAYRDAGGRAVRMAGSITDVTERRQTEQELRAAKDTAERAAKAKSDFLANMSHELRTPMNAIIGFTHRLQARLNGTISERDQDALKIVERNAQHLLRLINDLLDLSKVEAGCMELHCTTFDLPAAVHEVVEITTPLAENKNLAIRTEYPETALRITADAVKLKHMVTNLISNAINYTQHGHIAVRLSRRNDACLGEVAIIAVADTGIGISPEDQQQVFEKFGRLNNDAAAGVGGTGLGLPLTDEYVRLHGGCLHLTSEPGVGSEFVITLPLQLEPTPTEFCSAAGSGLEEDAHA